MLSWMAQSAVTLAAVCGAMQPATAQTRRQPQRPPSISSGWAATIAALHRLAAQRVAEVAGLARFQGHPVFLCGKSHPLSVPPKALLPAEVQPFKALLDEASGSHTGSPQGALIVNGVMHDYFLAPARRSRSRK